MPTDAVFPCERDKVKLALLEETAELVAGVLDAAEAGRSARGLELDVWRAVVTLGRLLLTVAFALRCRRAMLDAMDACDHDPDRARVRTDRDYQMTLTTTFGPVCFPVFAYRYPAVVGTTTHNGSREAVFPLAPKCRSSELCLEWESRLASLHPFRKAQSLLTFFTHGEVELEDTTIARHAMRVGHVIDQKWLYKSRDAFRQILDERATRDRRTDRPIVYLSSDAHALRRYVNESWADEWKMINGLRIWCVDKDSGSIIHIGGQFTCGDAAYLRDVVRQLIVSGYLPCDGDFGEGLVAAYVFVADGMPWVAEQLISQFPTATAILDAYHVLEHLAAYAAKRFGQGSLEAREWCEQARRLLLGPGHKPRPEPGRIPRKGHTKRKKGTKSPASPPPVLEPDREPAAEALLRYLAEIADDSRVHAQIVRYVTDNAYRMDYVAYRARGYQIGSGAMESLHRTGSQARLKRAGARWLPETLEAMFNLRMLDLAGRWDEFFAQPDLWVRQKHRFIATAYNTYRGPWNSKSAG